MIAVGMFWQVEALLLSRRSSRLPAAERRPRTAIWSSTFGSGKQDKIAVVDSKSACQYGLARSCYDKSLAVDILKVAPNSVGEMWPFAREVATRTSRPDCMMAAVVAATRSSLTGSSTTITGIRPLSGNMLLISASPSSTRQSRIGRQMDAEPRMIVHLADGTPNLVIGARNVGGDKVDASHVETNG